MKIRNYFTIALAALAMTACSENKIDGPVGPDNGGNFTPGESTYAMFKIKLGDGNSFRNSSSTGTGIENAVNAEDVIKEATIYLFEWETETTGRSDVSLDVVGSGGAHGGGWDIPAKPIMTSSGKKHVVVVANMTPATKLILDKAFDVKGTLAGYANFYAALAHEAALNPKGLFLIGTGATTNVTMLGESDVTLLAGVTETEASNPDPAKSKNHFNVYLDRALAKLDFNLGGVGAYANNMDVKTISLGTENAIRVGNISNVMYDVRNVNRKQYYLSHKRGTDFIVSPFSNIQPDDWKIEATRTAAFYPEMLYTSANDFNYRVLTSATDREGANYQDFVAYITENTNEQAAVANSSYTALKATYKPVNANYISGFINDADNSKIVTLTKASAAGTDEDLATVADGFSLFNIEYNLAFKAEATATDAIKLSYFKTIAAYHASKVDESLKDITDSKIKFVAGGILSAPVVPADGDDIIAVTGYDPTKPITDETNVTAISEHLEGKKAEPTLLVFVSKTMNENGKLEKITLSAGYFWKPNVSVNKFALNGGVNFGTQTFGVYNVADGGLTSYYRVNIFDIERAATHQMYYSVVRNFSYHVNVTKVNKIGFPTDFDVTIDPETPLNNNTFLQAHVIINKWVAKQMDTEL